MPEIDYFERVWYEPWNILGMLKIYVSIWDMSIGYPRYSTKPYFVFITQTPSHLSPGG